MTETQENKIQSGKKNMNIFDKIKSGFYWYNDAFEVWKQLMIANQNDSERIQLFSDYISSKMNMSTGAMKASSEEFREKLAAEREFRHKEFKEQVVERVLSVAKNKKFEWEDEEL